MRKQELYDFIEQKIKTSKRENSKKIELFEKTIRESLSKEIRGLDGLAAAYTSLTDMLEKAKVDHADSFDWSLNNRIRNSYDLISFKKDLVSNTFYRIVTVYLQKGRDAELKILESKYPNTLDVINALKPDYDSAVNSNSNANTLEKELKAIVKASGTGKQAYKSLVALGVDMTGFEESSSNLPAVQKLSVDVCFINGTC